MTNLIHRKWKCYPLPMYNLLIARTAQNELWLTWKLGGLYRKSLYSFLTSGVVFLKYFTSQGRWVLRSLSTLKFWLYNLFFDKSVYNLQNKMSYPSHSYPCYISFLKFGRLVPIVYFNPLKYVIITFTHQYKTMRKINLLLINVNSAKFNSVKMTNWSQKKMTMFSKELIL